MNIESKFNIFIQKSLSLPPTKGKKVDETLLKQQSNVV